jgi:hypothetical protein
MPIRSLSSSFLVQRSWFLAAALAASALLLLNASNPGNELIPGLLLPWVPLLTVVGALFHYESLRLFGLEPWITLMPGGAPRYLSRHALRSYLVFLAAFGVYALLAPVSPRLGWLLAIQLNFAVLLTVGVVVFVWTGRVALAFFATFATWAGLTVLAYLLMRRTGTVCVDLVIYQLPGSCTSTPDIVLISALLAGLLFSVRYLHRKRA